MNDFISIRTGAGLIRLKPNAVCALIPSAETAGFEPNKIEIAFTTVMLYGGGSFKLRMPMDEVESLLAEGENSDEEKPEVRKRGRPRKLELVPGNNGSDVQEDE